MATKYYGIKDNWTDDDVANVIEVASEDGSVSSVKVNGVEYGGGGGSSDGLLVTKTIGEEENFVLDKTWSEINTAYTAQLPIMFYDYDGNNYPTIDTYGYVSRCEYISMTDTYYVDINAFGATSTYTCGNANDHPSMPL